MKISFVLGAAGYTPENLETKCTINLEDGKITNSHLVLNARVEGISKEKFAEAVKNAEENCIISNLLNTRITVEYTLNS